MWSQVGRARDLRAQLAIRVWTCNSRLRVARTNLTTYSDFVFPYSIFWLDVDSNIYVRNKYYCHGPTHAFRTLQLSPQVPFFTRKHPLRLEILRRFQMNMKSDLAELHTISSHGPTRITGRESQLPKMTPPERIDTIHTHTTFALIVKLGQETQSVHRPIKVQL